MRKCLQFNEFSALLMGLNLNVDETLTAHAQ